jgi:hypothetical protein
VLVSAGNLKRAKKATLGKDEEVDDAWELGILL